MLNFHGITGYRSVPVVVARVVPVLMQLPVLVPGMSSPCSDGLGVTTGIGQAAVLLYCEGYNNTVGAEHKLEWCMYSTLMELISYC